MKIEINARNIVNLEEIDKFIDPFVDYVTDNNTPLEMDKLVIEWLNNQFKNYIKNRYEKVYKVTTFEDSDPDWLKDGVKNGTALEVNLSNRELSAQLYHIIDYFLSLSLSELKKIHKLTFEVAVDKSKKWTKTLQKNNLTVDSSGEVIVRKYSGNIVWKRLLTPEALEKEGLEDRMDHCIGGTVYKKKLLNNSSEFYSLRDNLNKPYCTIELVKTRVKQIKGYHDGPVQKDYIQYVLDFLNDPIKGAPYKVENDLHLIDAVTGNNNKYYCLLFPPSRLTVTGDVDLDGYSTTILPANFIFEGNVSLMGSSIYLIHKNVTIKGSLEAQYSQLITIMEGLTVEKSVNLNKCEIKKLPDNMTVGENLIIFGTNIQELPEDLIVKGILYISAYSDIESVHGVNKIMKS